MAYVDWLIRTKKIATCSCDYGCPCEFNAPPTRLPCEGVVAMEIAEGHFEDVPLDGLRAAGVYRYPGPIHEGHGTWWSIIDKRASPQQVDALSKILGGKEQDPTTGFAIYAWTVENQPEPIVADIEFEWDLDGRKGRFLGPVYKRIDARLDFAVGEAEPECGQKCSRSLFLLCDLPRDRSGRRLFRILGQVVVRH